MLNAKHSTPNAKRQFGTLPKNGSLPLVRRLAQRLVQRLRERPEISVALGTLSENGARDRLCEPRAVFGLFDQPRLAAVREVAALHEHAGELRIPREPQAAAHEAAAGVIFRDP